MLLPIIAWSKKAKEKPLVLQMTVSHPRNTDQTSLIFKGKTLLYVTNVHQSSKNATKPVQLGQFSTPITTKLHLFKKQIQAYKKLLSSERSPLKALLKKTDILRAIAYIPQTKPHMTRILIGGDGKVLEVKNGHPYFQALKQILIKARQSPYRCQSCATYHKKGSSVIRTVKKQNTSPQKRTFSRQQLECRTLDKKKIECVDIAYGLFEI